MPPSDFSLLTIFRDKVYIYYAVSILIIIAIVGGAFYINSKPKVPKSYQLTGAISRVEGNSVFIKDGILLVNGNQNAKAPETEVLVTPQTQITATVLITPLQTDLQKTNGVWDMKSVKREVMSGSLTELSGNVGKFVSVKSTSDIFGKKKFQADSISYSTIRENPNDPYNKIPKGICDDAHGVNIGAVACKKKIADFLKQQP